MKPVTLMYTVAGILVLAALQFPPPGVERSTPPPAPAWPPAARDIVVLDGQRDYHGPDTAAIHIYTVPKDRWFVVTDHHLYAVEDGEETHPDVIEVRGGESTGERMRVCRENTSRIAPRSSQFHVGLPFAPGSSVMLRFRIRDGERVTGRVCYHIRGYLERR